jgi:hypothetical protein
LQKGLRAWSSSSKKSSDFILIIRLSCECPFLVQLSFIWFTSHVSLRVAARPQKI